MIFSVGGVGLGAAGIKRRKRWNCGQSQKVEKLLHLWFRSVHRVFQRRRTVAAPSPTHYAALGTMAKGGKSKAKATKAFLKKGLLEGQITRRHEARKFKQKVVGRAVQRNKGGKPAEKEDSEDEADIKLDPASDSEEDEPALDDVLDGEADDDDAELEDDDLEGLSGEDDDQDGPVSNEQHIADLKALAEKDPEFFKYLQENDAELLHFGAEGAADDDSDEEMDDAEAGESDEDDQDSEDEEAEGKSKKGKGKQVAPVVKATPILTKEILKSWQTAIITVRFRLISFQPFTTDSLFQTRSIRALRKLLLAFGSAASSGTKEEGDRWEIQSPAGQLSHRRISRTLADSPLRSLQQAHRHLAQVHSCCTRSARARQGDWIDWKIVSRNFGSEFRRH